VIERVVLLGYMCSGKSSVAASLARRLGWRFLDFDVEIEQREGASVREIVEARGEEYLRELEGRLTDELAREGGVVAAPGGGWITQPELLDALGPETVSAWLSVTPEETVRRLREDSIERPLKDHPDPVPLVAEMIAERESLYRRADLRVPTDGRDVEEIAFELEILLRTRGCGTSG
jgi:shikimate kinase